MQGERERQTHSQLFLFLLAAAGGFEYAALVPFFFAVLPPFPADCLNVDARGKDRERGPR